MLIDLKHSKAQISKIIQSGGFLALLLSKLAGPLMKVAVSLAKNILAPLGIIAAASAIDAGIQKKIHGSGTTTLIVSNKEMNDIMKIVQALEYSNIYWKKSLGQLKMKRKTRRRIFRNTRRHCMMMLLGNLCSGKGIVRTGSGNKKGKGIVRAGYEKEWDF